MPFHSRRAVLGTGIAGAAYFLGVRARAAGETIKIGLSIPIGGPFEATANYQINGAKIAVEYVNANGGVLGRQLELVIRNDKGSPTEAVAAFRDLVGNGIGLILGGSMTSLSLAVLPVVKESDVVFTSISAVTMTLTHEFYNPKIFHYYPNPYMSLRAEARIIAQQYPNATKWTCVAPDIEYGHVTWNAFAGSLKEFYPKLQGKEITIIDPIFTALTAADYKTVIARMLGTGANGVYAALTGAPLVTFLTQCHEAQVDKSVEVWGDVGIDVTLGHALHRNMPPAYWTPTIWYSRAPDVNELSRFLLKRYTELTNDNLPAGLLTSSFSPLLGYAAAIKAAGSAEPAKVASALETITFDSPVGPVTYRKEDHQAMYKLAFIRMSAADNPEGYAVTDYKAVAAAEVIEPPTPGVAFTFPEVK